LHLGEALLGPDDEREVEHPVLELLADLAGVVAGRSA
jgi:hypothetical protein